MDGLQEFNISNFTNIIREDVYPAISPTAPTLSQVGKTVLITGGGVSLGLNIAKAFVKAAVNTVVITGRRLPILEDAKAELETLCRAIGTTTKIICRQCDLADQAQIDSLWTDLMHDGVSIDILILNASRPPQPETLLDSGVSEIWAQMEVNVRSQLSLVEKFRCQNPNHQKFIVYVSSAVIHSHDNPAVAARPGTILSRTAGTLLFQLIAMESSPDELQVVMYHPGLLMNEYFEQSGLPAEMFSSGELAGAFANWAATKEAAFLHGRFVWASWDVEELASGEVRKRLDLDPYFLRVGVLPLNRGSRAC